MVFSSLTFLFLYLPIVLMMIKLVPFKYRNLILFISSLIFYGYGEPKYILIMLLSTIVDYYHGYMVNKSLPNRKKAKKYVISSIIFNLSILGFFKYYDFIVLNLRFLGLDFLPLLNLSLPIGISFYTFQTMSYTIDIYRNDAKVQTNIISFGTYVAMFPQLIAGPIVRYKDISEQLNQRLESLDMFYAGVQRFMVGLAKKVLLANNIGLLWETIKATSSLNHSLLLYWLGIIAFAWQIYFDFSGYSDMAIGLGKMFGFNLLENFNYPYIANSITDFWRRWHMSLGQWFRDYVYIPLGGNRHGIFRTYLNIFLVWLLTGFWHGASWNYIFWGLYFGLILMFEKTIGLKILKKLPNYLRQIYALFLVLIGWVLFAFEDLSAGFNYLQAMFNFNQPLVNDYLSYLIRDNITLIIVLIIASTPMIKNLYQRYINNKKYEIIVIPLVLFGLILCTAFIVDASYNPFLYFRF